MLAKLTMVRLRLAIGTAVVLLLAGLLNVLPAEAAGPESLFGAATPAVASDSETVQVELGLQFKVAVDGQINGVRFYKGSANTGTHTGSLWVGSTRAATATFSGETASGWQQVAFPKPVNVKAGTIYTASYLAPNGRYAVNNPYTFPKSTGNLTAIKGVYRYGGGNPTAVYQTSNYWVDVLFTPTVAAQSTTPQPLRRRLSRTSTAPLAQAHADSPMKRTRGS
jgi:hypothetical protein